MTALDSRAVLPARHAAEAASARPGLPGRYGRGAGDRAMMLYRAKAACDRAQQLMEEAQELLAQAQVLTQASADSHRALLRSLPPRLRRELLQRSQYARLLAQLETMPVIEQAKGILMVQSRCSDAEAFDLLRRASQRSNIPVRELAAQIVANTMRAPRAAKPERYRKHSVARAQQSFTPGQSPGNSSREHGACAKAGRA